MRVRINDSGNVFFFTAREEEAEQLLRAGMAKPLGRPGKKVRCLQLQCSRKQAHVFLRGGRYLGQASKTFRIERVGDQRHRLFVHDVERCEGFRPELKVTAAAPIISTVEIIQDEVPTQPEATKGVLTMHTLGGPAVDPEVLQPTPIERGSNDAEREPERVPVEPETPDVAAPAKPAHPITHAETFLPAEQHDISRHRDLARAIILRAFEDSQTDPIAQRWFEASQGMLEFWCQLAQLDPGRVRRRAREMMRPEERARVKAVYAASQ